MTEQVPEGSAATSPGDAQDKDTKKKRRGALWGWWDRYNRWSRPYNIFSWLFGASKMGTLASVAATGVAITTAGLVVYTVTKPDPKPGELVTVSSQQLSDTSILFPVEGHDKEGRVGRFDVVVLTKNFGWVHGSTYQLMRDGTILSGPDTLAQIFNADVRDSFNKAQGVIAAGVASQEGKAETETWRAGERSRQTATWLAPIVDTSLPLWTLNLGQYHQPCTDCATSGTDWQRPLILIAVRQLDPDTNMGEALADALRGKTNLPSPESYSDYTLTRFR